MATLAIHVTPKTVRDEIAGWRGSELALRVTSPPEGGKANAAACALVADALGLPKGRVRVARGESARHKLLEIDGVGREQLVQTFGQPDEPLF